MNTVHSLKNTVGARDWEDHSSRLAWTKVCKTPSLSMVGHHGTCLPSQHSTNRKIIVQTGLGIKQDSVSKITNGKRVAGVVQEVELEALSSTTSSEKKNKTENVYNKMKTAGCKSPWVYEPVL
jgi:hypothetical protein